MTISPRDLPSATAPLDAASIEFLDEQASRVLDLCRSLRLADSAIVTTRQELDEVASLVVACNPLEPTPDVALTRLSVVTGRLIELETKRDAVRLELDTLVGTVPGSVPDRVHSI